MPLSPPSIVAPLSACSDQVHFKFINIAPCKVRNDDWTHFPENAVPGGEGLILMGCGRYRKSQTCLAYVPLPSCSTGFAISRF